MKAAIENYRVISVTPAGRERYLKILVPYLLENRHLLSEHHFWLNTLNPGDIAYIESLADRYPDFFVINRREVFNKNSLFDSIWQYYQDYTEDDSVYLRLDDDICYIAPDAIPTLIDYRLAHTRPFLVFGNIINNAVCSHIHQSRGTIPLGWGATGYDCLDWNGWHNPRFAERLHKEFLADLRLDRLARWKFADWTIEDYRRFSINVISWFGKDMRLVDELRFRDLENAGISDPVTGNQVAGEEPFVSEILPRRYSRPCEICGEAIFAHFAFYTQRPYLEEATALRVEYQSLALGYHRLPLSLGLRFWELLKKARYGVPVQKAKEAAAATRPRIRKLRVRFRIRKLNLITRFKTRIMIKTPRFYAVLRKIKRAFIHAVGGRNPDPPEPPGIDAQFQLPLS